MILKLGGFLAEIKDYLIIRYTNDDTHAKLTRHCSEGRRPFSKLTYKVNVGRKINKEDFRAMLGRPVIVNVLVKKYDFISSAGERITGSSLALRDITLDPDFLNLNI